MVKQSRIAFFDASALRIAYAKRYFFFLAFIIQKPAPSKITYAKKFAILLQCTLIFETTL